MGVGGRGSSDVRESPQFYFLVSIAVSEKVLHLHFMSQGS